MRDQIKELILTSRDIYNKVYDERSIGDGKYPSFTSDDLEFLDALDYIVDQLELIIKVDEN
jgi:hypothetical protein|tara:strand:+ start:485 stop:667 length:183 start_codon:yes stop_codon:yes gene_type:complete